MYQDWKQWARLAYSIFTLTIVWKSMSPELMPQWEEWGRAAGRFQLVALAISAGLIFPRAKRFSDDLPLSNDAKSFMMGLALNLLGLSLIFFS